MNQQTVNRAIQEAFQQVQLEMGGPLKILIVTIPEDFDYEAFLKEWTECMYCGVMRSKRNQKKPVQLTPKMALRMQEGWRKIMAKLIDL